MLTGSNVGWIARRVGLAVMVLVAAASCARKGGGELEAAAAQPTPEELLPLEEKLLALEGCGASHDYSENFLERSCEARREFRLARDEHKDAEDASMVMLAAKHLGHDREAVRIGSALLLAQPFAVREGGVAPLLAASQRETDTRVLSSFVWVLGNEARRHDDVAAWLVAQAAHEHPEVRRIAVYLLASPGAYGVEGRFATLRHIAREDADESVRATACLQLVEADGDAAPEAIAEVLAEVERGSEVYSSCLYGLMHLWAYTTSGGAENAYRLALAELGEASDWHAWNQVLMALVGPRVEHLKQAEWFDREPLFELLAGLLRARGGSVDVRHKAVETLVELDAPAALLAELYEAYEGAEGAEARVKQALAAATGSP
jgi:hypothetical protein